ncbi:tetratricopeptide repeat protein [Nocardioides sp. GY 10113]|uniref:co-chaperone YbbN n=1 Tax=Nocardioides sp. GY 10113 TaxID=2569761 RepID=UPI0010A89275|nr:tetratricopeptide repeat protein [Nocardioides sp. GY 10113]TIC88159.1 tetratricopeptide repeat protein [Nocardioides sp. GY 10113]
MTQQPFSRPGAIDLSSLKRPAAPPAPAGGPSAAGGPASAYAVAVDVQNFQPVIESSMTAPVVLVFISPSQAPASVGFADDVAQVAGEYDGRFLAAIVDVDASPQIAQAMQLPPIAEPLMLVVLDGRPVTQPIPGAAPIDDIRAMFNQLAQQLTAQGFAGRHQPLPQGGGDDAEEPAADPRYAPAQEALAAGDIDGAVAEYQKLVDGNPADAEAAAGLAMAQLLQRTQGVDLNAARAAAAAAPDDVDAQIMVADLDLLGGHVEDSFARLVELVRRTADKDRDRAREHLVRLFAAVGTDDPRVLKGRQALASALF